jgi:molecular chaperone DnaK
MKTMSAASIRNENHNRKTRNKEKIMTEKIFGIDLGTTNSCLAVLEDKPRVIPIDGSGIVPSVVSFDRSSILVGRKALNRSMAFPEESVRSIKRLMGTSDKVNIGEQTFEPEKISSLILSYLRDEAKIIEGIDVKRVVITVPAYFSEAQRRATLKAGELAGLKVERIINEPTAAALFYDLLKVTTHVGETSANQGGYSLVYDLGGGTFDVSILRMGDITEVLSSLGDTHLGGDDFDLCLATYLVETMELKNTKAFLNNRSSMARLLAIAEKVKIQLSTRGSSQIMETRIPGPDRSDYSLQLTVVISEFEALTEHLVNKTITLTEKALSEANLLPTDIERVLLVGGMTRMPVISRRLSAIFGKAQLPAVDPDLSVAKGAAVQGGIITGENYEQILVDVTAHTLSLMANDFLVTKCVPIIPRNTPIPATRSQLFRTGVPNQKMGVLAVFQGESDLPKENEFVGASPFYLNSANSHSSIEVEFSYDHNGMIHLVAEQVGHKRKIAIDLDSRNPYSEAGTVTGWDTVPATFKSASLADDDVDYDENLLTQEYDDQDDDDDDFYPDEDESKQMNIVLKRAHILLAHLEEGEERAQLAELTNRYRKALLEDSENIDEFEDELLNFLESR